MCLTLLSLGANPAISCYSHQILNPPHEIKERGYLLTPFIEHHEISISLGDLCCEHIQGSYLTARLNFLPENLGSTHAKLSIKDFRNACNMQ